MAAGLAITWSGVNDWRIFPADEPGVTAHAPADQAIGDDRTIEPFADSTPKTSANSSPRRADPNALLTCIMERHPDSYGYVMNENKLSDEELGVSTTVRAIVDTRDTSYRIRILDSNCNGFTKLGTLAPGRQRLYEIPQGSYLEVTAVGDSEVAPVTLGPVSNLAPLGYGGASFAYESTNVLWGENLREADQ